MSKPLSPAVDTAILSAHGVTRGGQPLSYNRAPEMDVAPWIGRLYAAKVAALCDVLKREMPRLVEDALRARNIAVSNLVTDLSEAEWDKLKRDEDRRRTEAKTRSVKRQ